MEKLSDMSGLSGEAKDALIIALWEEIQRLRQRLSGLEKPKKTSANSSVPPSKGFKANKKPSKRKKGGERRAASIGRAGGGRQLHPSPNETVIAHLQCCPDCSATIPQSKQRLHSRYDRIELPEIAPVVTRVERYQGECTHWHATFVAPVPTHLAPGSPFGQSIESLAAYLRYGHAISYERLHQVLGEVFNLSISEGAIANLLTRVKDRFEKPLSEILTHLQQAKLICSDETSARANGKNEWEWVFQNPEVCFHTICATRGGSVIYAALEDALLPVPQYLLLNPRVFVDSEEEPTTSLLGLDCFSGVRQQYRMPFWTMRKSCLKACLKRAFSEGLGRLYDFSILN